jgi:uncharacterized membrane protein
MKTTWRRIAWILMLVPAIYLFAIWDKIPQTVPLHFSLSGNVDKYGTRNDLVVLILSLTFVNAIVYLIITNIYKIDPKKYAVQNKERMQRMAFSVSVYLSAVWMMLIYAIAHNDPAITVKFVFIAAGLLFALLGNNMYNIKPNYFAGLRLPWTLENEDNWRKTHQLAGRLWFFGGIFFSVIVLFVNKQYAGYTGVVFLSLLILIPVIYSYNLYKHQQKS